MLENSLIYIIYFIVFYFGAIMGSFLNVIAFELEPNVFKTKEERKKSGTESFWKRINRRSHCNSCGKNLNFLDLFPIFSYIFSFGKCRHCGVKYSPRYLFVEIFSGILFMGMFYKIFNNVFDISFWINFSSLTLIFSGLILIFLFDLKHKIIPDLILIPLFFLSALFLFISGEFYLYTLVYSLIAAFPLWALWFISHGKWMGFADWKLVFILAMFFSSLESIYSFGVLSFWYGMLYSLPLIFLSKKYELSSEVPFGPFILLSFWTIYIYNFDVLVIASRLINN